ncbi:MAG: PorV/PorQ family protein [Rhodothermales bacterium]
MKAKTNITNRLWLFLLVVCMTSMGATEVKAQFGSQGESGSRAGTAGAQELLVPVTARYAALGGAMTSGMEDMNGLEALFANPAGLSVNDGTAAMFSRVEYVADIGINYLGVAQNFGYNNIAFTITSWDFGDIAEQTESAPEISDVTFNINYLTAGLSYSRQLTDRIAAGGTMKLISESIDDVSANAVAFDAGMTYDITGSGLRLGVALKNIGNELTFSGSGLTRTVPVPGQEPSANNNTLSLTSEGVQLPTLLNVGLSYTRDLGANAIVRAMGNFRSNSFEQDQFAGGIELGVMDIIYVRGGYSATEDMDETFFNGPSFGAGLKLDLGGTQLMVDYAYQTTDFFSDVQYITAAVKL